METNLYLLYLDDASEFNMESFLESMPSWTSMLGSSGNLWLVEASSADEIRSLFSGHSFNNLLVIQCEADYSAIMDTDHIDCCSFIDEFFLNR